MQDLVKRFGEEDEISVNDMNMVVHKILWFMADLISSKLGMSFPLLKM